MGDKSIYIIDEPCCLCENGADDSVSPFNLINLTETCNSTESCSVYCQIDLNDGINYQESLEIRNNFNLVDGKYNLYSNDTAKMESVGLFDVYGGTTAIRSSEHVLSDNYSYKITFAQPLGWGRRVGLKELITIPPNSGMLFEGAIYTEEAITVIINIGNDSLYTDGFIKLGVGWNNFSIYLENPAENINLAKLVIYIYDSHTTLNTLHLDNIMAIPHPLMPTNKNLMDINTASGSDYYGKLGEHEFGYADTLYYSSLEEAYSGLRSFKYVCKGVNEWEGAYFVVPYQRFLPGENYTFSARIKGTPGLRLDLEGWVKGGDYIVGDVFECDDTFRRYDITIPAGSDPEWLSTGFYICTPEDDIQSGEFYVDEVQLEMGDEATDYVEPLPFNYSETVNVEHIALLNDICNSYETININVLFNLLEQFYGNDDVSVTLFILEFVDVMIETLMGCGMDIDNSIDYWVLVEKISEEMIEIETELPVEVGVYDS